MAVILPPSAREAVSDRHRDRLATCCWASRPAQAQHEHRVDHPHHPALTRQRTRQSHQKTGGGSRPGSAWVTGMAGFGDPAFYGDRWAGMYDEHSAVPDPSAAVVGQMRTKPGGEAIPVAIGDMAEVPADGPFRLVYLVFNTLFGLLSQA